jgi:DNA-directed RNA polymerase subunit N (RpoN/RPB10)
MSGLLFYNSTHRLIMKLAQICTLKIAYIPGSKVSMPIPVRCMNCGNVLADLWRYYQRRTKELRGGQAATLLILDETKLPKTPEGDILNELGLHRYCCRKELLTYRETY